jgi:hypothetical protein
MPECRGDLNLDPSHREYARVQQDREIHKEIAMTDIVEIVLDVLVNQERTITAQLPESRNSRLYSKPLSLQRRVLLDNERHFGSGSN